MSFLTFTLMILSPFNQGRGVSGFMGLKCWLGLNHDKELQDHSGFSSCPFLPKWSQISWAIAKAGSEMAGELQSYSNALSPNHCTGKNKICLSTELFPCVHVCAGQPPPAPLEMQYICQCLLTDKITFVSCCSSSRPALKSAVLLRPVSAHLPPSFPASIQRAH